MWYEIIPAFGIIYGALALVQWAPTFIPTLVYDRPSGMKRLIEPYELEYWKRDRQLTGSPYKLQGLEAIPDEDASTKK